ncbi:gamma-glutamyltransferase [Sphingomonas canadensis]|uniref:Glutathione hydrolase proenzyme n=1 Tax=Sphingomonas canadensis TaxID=1219257 RepID=A0ABW3HB64_9SPHN|nr:gamma-glutamyltransferase [Sphingomonas canadensis]MCW3838372.1 gamma-glutamyltransferase [Sphingomonas canadensis]
MRKLFAALLFLLLFPAAAMAQGVVASADPRATEAGREMLRQGGSATDAALAMMLALTVVEPQSSGIGGGGFLLHHDGASGVIDTIDGRETAPESADSRRFLGPDDKPMPFLSAVQGGLSVGVPGNMRLMALAHRRWGKLEWKALFAPAIRLAEEGFDVTPPLAATMKLLGPVWREKFPQTAALYLDANGEPLPVGTHIRNPALAKLLRQLAEQGPDAFYKGENAAAIVNAVASFNPGHMTLGDLESYRAKERPAVCGSYRRFTVCGMGPPSSGATTVLQMLGMLERFDMKKLGKDSPQAWLLIGEAMRLAYADREKYLGDGDFVPVPVAGLLDPDYLKRRSRLIAPGRARGSYQAGSPPGAPRRTVAVQAETPGTTHFVAVDRNGDIVSMTSTIEGPFGSQLIANGMALNNELTDFTFAPEKDGAPVANRVQAGKRPLSSMAPTIVYDENGKPVLALGSAGGKRIIMHVMKTLVGVLDWGLPADQAIALPNIFFDDQGLTIEANGEGTALAAGVARIAPARAVDMTSKVTALERTAAGWRGAADPRSVGTAANE